MIQEVFVSGRRGGKTSRLLQEVIDYLAEAPEDHTAFIVTHDARWRNEIDQVCSRMGLPNVIVVSEKGLEARGLLGLRGALFIDNVDLTQEGIYHPLYKLFEVRIATTSERL